jgi:NADH:ubiquinone oxidoreductase subunit 5 (subunit L)/multisubunit Na+/H+ antiporter MnhA subunit
MTAGAVYLQTKELDIYKLGGLWRKMPITAALSLIASFGIAGVPLFNGFASKSVLHHAIVEAYEYGSPSFQIAEWLFIIISMGTAATFMKMYYHVFMGPLPDKFKDIKPVLRSLHFPMVALAIFIVLIGFNPNYLLNTMIIPALLRTSYDPAFIATYIAPLEFFTFNELSLAAIILSGGFTIAYVGERTKALQFEPPRWLRFEYILFYPLNLLLLFLCRSMYGSECALHQAELKQLEVKNNFQVGVLERVFITTSAFNQRYENSIISSDSILFLGMLLLMSGFFFFA